MLRSLGFPIGCRQPMRVLKLESDTNSPVLVTGPNSDLSVRGGLSRKPEAMCPPPIVPVRNEIWVAAVLR